MMELREDSSTPAVQLNSSVLVLDRVSLLNAASQVNRLADLGETRLMLVLSLQCRLDKTLTPYSYGLMIDRTNSWSEAQNFEPMTAELLAEYRESLKNIFASVEERDLELAILLHLDPAGEINEWRNLYDFDPRQKIRGYSYQQVLIDSCLSACKSELSIDRPVSFSIAGEMGKSLAKYPESYSAIVKQLRSQLVGRRVKIGISLNHNELFADERLTDNKRSDVQHLVDQLDFIGLSHYRPFTPPAKREDFQVVVEQFVSQLNQHGIRLPSRMPLHFSEIGIGGAPDEKGETNPDRAAKMPWEGTNDPSRNPWDTTNMRNFRRGFYSELLSFLQSPNMPYRLEEAYLWCESSWDPVGVANFLFSDPEIRKAILEHNQRCQNKQKALEP